MDGIPPPSAPYVSPAAMGPAPWKHLVILIALWVPASWLGAESGIPHLAVATLLGGLLGFWLLIPKERSKPPRLPGWSVLPLGAAFVAILLAAGMLASVDEELTGAAYGLTFLLWLQLGLWLMARYGRRPDEAGSQSA